MSTITVTAIYMSSVLSLVSMIVPLYSIRLMQLVVPAVPGQGDNGDMDRCGALTARPVLIATGEKIKLEPDFQSMGQYGLGLTRTYRSRHAVGTLFGAQWLSNLDMPRLKVAACAKENAGQCVPRFAVVTEPSGRRTRYGYTGGDTLPAQGTSYLYVSSKVMQYGDLVFSPGIGWKLQKMAVLILTPPSCTSLSAACFMPGASATTSHAL